MKIVPLSKGYFALVDDEDYALVSQYHWHVNECRGHLYARTAATKPRTYMHNLIMQPDFGLRVDHKNNNGLDNQKHNLDICTHGQNVSRGKWNLEQRAARKALETSHKK